MLDPEIEKRMQQCLQGGGNRLDLTGCGQITHATLLEMAGRVPNLTSLELSGCEQIRDKELGELAGRLPGLTSLDLMGCGQITDAGLKELASKVSSLTSLNLSWCDQITDVGLGELARNLTALARLDFWGCKQITDAGLKEVAGKLRNLTSLKLEGCDQITDAGLRELAWNLSGLTSLDLRDCRLITDAGLAELAEKAHGLISLDLWACKQITDSGVTALARNLPGLTSLDLSWCHLITDAGLQELAQNLSCLTSLELWGCRLITDAGLMELARKQPGLTNLALGGCKHITDEAIKELSANLPRLSSLDLSACNQITDAGLSYLAEATSKGKMQRLQILYLEQTKVLLPQHVLRPGNASEIFRAFDEARRSDAQSLTDVKVLLVGQGEVGKTHLRKRLFVGERSEPRYYHPLEERTPSIEFGRWSGTATRLGGGGSPWRYRIWDFGGQDHLHGTHRFFVGAEHCIYLLLLDATRSSKENRLDYWLRFLAHHGTSSQVDADGNPQRAPVIIILNKCDLAALARQKDAPAELDVTNTLKRAPSEVRAAHDELTAQLKLAEQNDWYGSRVLATIDGLGFCPKAEQHRNGKEWVASHQAALDAIAREIEAAAEATVGRGLRFARGFFTVKDWLETQFAPSEGGTVPWIDYQSPAFTEAFAEAQVQDDAAKIDWLKRLRDLGTAHWVGDLAEISLGTETRIKRGVFNPAWVKLPVYEVIQTPQGQHDRGWVQLGALEQRLARWNQDERDLIRRLMTACGLACEVVDRMLPNGILVPDLLEARGDGHLEDWRGPEVQRTLIRLPFLPERAFLRYVASKYASIADRRRNCWRDQVEMTTTTMGQTCSVLVQSHVCPGNGQQPFVLIAVKGGDGTSRRVLADRVCDELIEIFKSESLRDWKVVEDNPAEAARPSGKKKGKAGTTKKHVEAGLNKIIVELLKIQQSAQDGPVPSINQKELADLTGLSKYQVTRYLQHNSELGEQARKAFNYFAKPEVRGNFGKQSDRDEDE